MTEHDLAGDDIVMTSSPDGAGALAENGASAGSRVDPAVSLVSAAVSTPTFAPDGKVNNLVTQ
ncbi:MAG: hypothetical protein R2698_12390 [Microthrixaceae bacterium]